MQVDDQFYNKTTLELLGKHVTDVKILMDTVAQLKTQLAGTQKELNQILESRTKMSQIMGDMHLELEKLDPEIAKKFAESPSEEEQNASEAENVDSENSEGGSQQA